jgi:hypothetical protein
MTSSASAHVLKTDSTIGAVLHIDPDDNPVSGQTTSYSLAFKDTSGKFSLANCVCSVVIQQNGQAVYSQKLAQTGDLTSQDEFTFPTADVYSLVVNGRPNKVGDFQAFTLKYLVRVTGGNERPNNQPFPLLLRSGLSLSIALILLGVYKVLHNKEPV